MIAHPTAVLSGKELTAVVAGPAIYLLGLALFRLRMAGSLAWKRLIGAGGCVAVGVVGALAPALVVEALLVMTLVTVIGWEELDTVRRRARGEPSPYERLEVYAARD